MELKDGEYRCVRCRGWGGSSMFKKHDKGCTLCDGTGITDIQYGVCFVCHMRDGQLGIAKEECPCCKGFQYFNFNDEELKNKYKQCPICKGTGLDNKTHDCMCCDTKGYIDGDRNIKCKKCQNRGWFGLSRSRCRTCHGYAFMNSFIVGKHNSDEFWADNKECPKCDGTGDESVFHKDGTRCHCCDGGGIICKDWTECRECRTTGKVDDEMCRKCYGWGYGHF